MKSFLFRIYSSSPNFIKNILKRIYYRFLQNKDRNAFDKKILSKLSKTVKKFKLHNDSIFIEMKSGLKFYAPLKQKITSKKSSLKEAMSLSPIITEFPEILDEKSYEKFCDINKGNIVVDAGANIGAFTILASRLVGPEGKVIAIEPERKNMHLLKRNAKINKCKNIIFVEKGIAEKKGKIRLYMNESATHSMYKELIGNSNANYTDINIDTLGAILSSIKISSVDFIKMDIEGAEIVALKGAMPILKKYHPTLSIAAYHYVNKKHTYKTLVPLLESIGYDIKHSELPHIYASKK